MKPLMAANWKLNKTKEEIEQFVEEFSVIARYIPGDRDVMIAPVSLYIDFLAEKLNKSMVGIGAQNMYWEEQGAFTGELSPVMIKNSGCSYVIIGHSERRQYFCETNESVNKKVKSALNHDLIPIMCCGETLEQRESGETISFITQQVKEGLADIKIKEPEKLVLAYEPIWAIGTGKTATPQLAQEVHGNIRKILIELFGADIGNEIRILYGGSVKPNNVHSLMEMDDINGALVGGASLDPVSFYKIIRYDSGGNE